LSTFGFDGAVASDSTVQRRSPAAGHAGGPPGRERADGVRYRSGLIPPLLFLEKGTGSECRSEMGHGHASPPIDEMGETFYA
jgi:hypothetical protein